MSFTPHPDIEEIAIHCAVITASDTRTPQTDRSGQIIQQLLIDAGHRVGAYEIVRDEPQEIQNCLTRLCADKELDALIFNGGTGIAPRDTTYDAIAGLLEKTLPGFGELFRFLSYQEIGSRAIATRAVAGIYRQKLIFCLPGSSNAVKLGLTQLVMPELVHLVKQLKYT